MEILLKFVLDIFKLIFGGAKKAPGIPMPGPTPDKLPAPGDAILPALNRVLASGMDGEDVRALQERLKAIGYTDLNVDGQFGRVTKTAVQAFQASRNLDPDGEVGPMTWAELAKKDAPVNRPPLLPPGAQHEAPAWYALAEKDIGFKERGNNQGLDRLINEAGGIGQNGDPWCAIFVNAKLRQAGFATSGSAMARSFEHHSNFVKLSGPALGAIVTMWRGSLSSGSGHVYFYDGESKSGIRGIGGNETDQVKRSFHERGRFVGYYWPKSVPLPNVGPIAVSSSGTVNNTKET